MFFLLSLHIASFGYFAFLLQFSSVFYHTYTEDEARALKADSKPKTDYGKKNYSLLGLAHNLLG